MSEEPAFAQIPSPQSKYQLLMELGKGGMGVVHLAMSRGPKGFVKLVVLKMLRRQLLGEEECHKMFMEEARISARLNHPNIVHIFEVTDIDEAPTIVMEYLEGQTLSALLAHREKPMPMPLALHIVSRTLAGLQAAHDLCDYDGTPLQLIHRDVSPHNIFVLFDGRVKVLDFGIAKAAGSEVETRTGELKGKIRYMAPEQILRDPQDRRVDLFSVGVMLWELLTRSRMWAGRPDGDIVRSLLNKSVPPLPKDGSIPEALAQICEKALAPDPAERYATAAAFQADLERYLASVPEQPSEVLLSAWIRGNFGAASDAARRVIDTHVKAAERSASGAGSSFRGPLTSTRLRAVMPPLDREEGETRVIPSSSEAPPPESSHTPATFTHHGASASPSARPPGVGLVARNLLLVLSLLVGGSGLGVALLEHRHAAASAKPHLTEGQARPCATGFKRCDGQCVSIDRPDYGCGSDTCTPCRLGNATARCNQQHACDIAICFQSYEDCDQSSSNGCESNVRIDADHCGSCSKRCPNLAHAQRGCGDVCTVWRCEAGFHDCNHEVADGCEVNTQVDGEHCGRCGLACKAGHRCQNGHCTP